MKLRPFIHYALQGIRQDRQRALIAVLAVAFGVMSLVAMISVSQSISTVLLADPRYEIGSDAWFWRESRYLSEEDLAQIAAYAESGAIEQWAPVADSPTLMLKVPGSGRVTFLRDGVGFEPGTYPMVGEIVLRSGASLAEVLQQPDDVVITKDIAAARGLSVGDTVLIGNQLGGSAQPYRVAGIAVQTPAYHGSTAYYDLETAAQIMGRPNPVTNVAVTWAGDEGETRDALVAAGWKVFAPDTLNERTRQMRSTFNLMLKGAGLLGLMVGGIGIANTMQVLLRRRREEVAVLKTLGYARRDVLLIFTLETALIGLTGSLMGAAAGVGLSALLVDVASNVVTLFINWQFSPGLVVGGIAVGVVTTILFAANAILQAGNVRPMHVFRRLPTHNRAQLHTLVTFGVMTVPFAAIASLVLGSLWQGLAVLGAALVGLLLLGGTLAGIKWLVLHLLPTFGLHLLRMARNNLRRRGFSLVFAMIALCIGTFTLGLAMTIIGGAQEQLELQMFATEGYNLLILTDPAQASEAEAAAFAVSDKVGLRYEAPLETVTTADGRDISEQLGTLSLQGRETLWDVTIEGAAWGTRENLAYLPAGLDIEADTLTVTDYEGTSLTLTVAGTYEVTGQWDRSLLPEPEGILVPAETLRAFNSEDAFALVAAEVPPRQLETAAQEVSTAVPEMMVATATDINESFKSTFRNLSAFAVAMAGLALVAGGVLIANAVSLAMIERRYEIGVLKAMGYTRGQVLCTILLEYGLVGTLAGVLGVLGVVAFTVVLAMVQEVTEGVLTIDPLSGLFIVGVAVGLTLIAALTTAWRPTSVRPMVVLNAQG
ncbi:MAG: ABC transporter permease [Anaerolineae bacterium]